MKRIGKILNIIKKLLKKENILIIRQNISKWNKQFYKGRWNFLLEDQDNILFIAKLCSKISNNKNISILDIGCGNGALALSNEKLNFNYIGIDFSEEAIKKAKGIYPDGKFIICDVENPGNINKKFDVIILSEILYYVDFKKIINVYKKFLKKNSIFIISMYFSWRNFIIWILLNKILKCNSRFKVNEKHKKQSWTIKICQLK